MQPTVKSLRQGSKVLIGKYSVDNLAEPVPISWTKATPNGDFIATNALDFLCFDAREQAVRENGATYMGSGNPNYLLSNIHCFLNSTETSWYIPQHTNDNAPSRQYGDIEGHVGTYTDHYGFLHHFEDFELSCILPQTFTVGEDQITSKIRLPKLADVFGDSKFNLFKKKGVRAHPSVDLIDRKGRVTGYEGEVQFMPYFLADKHDRSASSVSILDRMGYVSYSTPARAHGIRPTCKLRLDAKVEEIADGIYELIPFDVQPMAVGTTEEILALLGLV